MLPCNICFCTVIGLIFLGAFLILYLIILLFFRDKMSSIIRYEEEKYYLNPTGPNKEKHKFPSLNEPPTIELSIIIPAYNEEKRLPVMLEECIAFLENRVKKDSKYTYEIIVVDDGSSDYTTDIALDYVERLTVNKFRVLTLKKNRGKGGAVRLGMLSARGKLLLFADADGATKFEDIVKLEDSMVALRKQSDNCVVVGSRAHLEKEAIATRSVFRNFLMWGFHTLVWLFGVRNVKDTQCGFKLFTREAALTIFKSLHVERWAFDVELLYIANQLSMKLDEVSVNWTEIDGSKIVPVFSWLQMGKDLVLIWLKYQTRLWKISVKQKEK